MSSDQGRGGVGDGSRPDRRDFASLDEQSWAVHGGNLGHDETLIADLDAALTTVYGSAGR